ncbi:hypothetical protein QFZ63_005307 [Streptomyces sp. B3I7]|nr:hypothetical protein [Streptomyces sp. B3I7]
MPRAVNGCETGRELWSAYRLTNSETPSITDGGVCPMGMTIAVYRVNHVTGERPQPRE